MTRSMLGLLAVVMVTATVSAQNKPDGVVQKAIEAHGGLTVLKKFPAGASKIAGKVSINGTDFPFSGSLVFTIPGRVRSEMTMETPGQKVTVVQVVNGDKVHQTENGRRSQLDEPVQRELRESAVIQEMSLLYPLLDTTKYTLVQEKDVPVGGEDAAVIVVQSKGLKDTRLFFDRKTGRLVAMQRRGLDPSQKAVDEVTTFSDYKTIDGLVVPMKSKVAHDGKSFLEIIVAEYKPLEKVDDKPFMIE
jgi:hypothetical protein